MGYFVGFIHRFFFNDAFKCYDQFNIQMSSNRMLIQFIAAVSIHISPIWVTDWSYRFYFPKKRRSFANSRHALNGLIENVLLRWMPTFLLMNLLFSIGNGLFYSVYVSRCAIIQSNRNLILHTIKSRCTGNQRDFMSQRRYSQMNIWHGVLCSSNRRDWKWCNLCRKHGLNLSANFPSQYESANVKSRYDLTSKPMPKINRSIMW